MSTLSWERCGTRFFRTFEAPALKWKVAVGENHVLSAPCGGVTAVYERDDVLVTRAVREDARKPALRLFSGDGTELGRVALDFGPVSGAAFSRDETLVLTTASGLARHYTDLGANFVQLRLRAGAREPQVFDDGYVVRVDADAALALQFVRLGEGGAARVRDAERPLAYDVVRWLLLPPLRDERPARIAVLDAAGALHSYNLDLEQEQLPLQGLPTAHVALSASGRLIAFSDGASAHVYETDLRTQVWTQPLPEHTALHFVGDDALALHTAGDCVTVVDLADPAQSAEVYFDDDELSLQSEVDALRVLGRRSHELLLPVSAAAEATLKLGSVAPAAILYSCVDQIKAGSPRANATVQALERATLRAAVDTCIEAALGELEPKAQEKLLRAARFGKSVLPLYDSARYVDALTALRIGNAVRERQLFVTHRQLRELGLPLLLRRLQLRRLWAEAVAVARLERAPFENVYAEWACCEIQRPESHALPDEDLLGVLDQRLLKLPALSYTRIVRQALIAGRKHLALELVSREPVAASRVALLLEMDDVQHVLEQAIASGDLGLVDYVLMVLGAQLSVPQLMRLLNNNALALRRQQMLLEALHPTKAELHEFLSHMDQRELSLRYDFRDVVRAPDLAEQAETLANLSTRFGALGKKLALETKACSDWSKLLALQTQLEQDFHEKFVGKSCAETVATLLRLAQPHVAQKTASKLGIADRQFWWLHLQSLAERHMWTAVYDLAISAKSPIGYQPFFDACFQAQNLPMASRFVAMIQEASLEDKVKLYLKVNDIDKARELAAKSRSVQVRKLVEEVS